MNHAELIRALLLSDRKASAVTCFCQAVRLHACLALCLGLAKQQAGHMQVPAPELAVCSMVSCA